MPLCPQAALLRAVAYLFQYLSDKPGITEFAHAGFHQDADHGARFNGIDAQVVGDGIQLGQVIGFPDAAIGPQQAQGFVLDRRDNLITVGAGIHVTALNQATRHAGVFLLAAAGNILPAHEITAHLHGFPVGVNQASGGEITHRETAYVIGIVSHHGSAETFVAVDHLVLTQFFRVIPHSGDDFFPFVQLRHPVQVRYDCLDFFAAQHGADPASCSQPGRAPVGIADSDSGEQPPVFANGAAQGPG